MKNILLAFVCTLTLSPALAQKKKGLKGSKPATSTKVILATSGYMTAEMQKNIFLVTIDNQKSEKDTIQFKSYAEKVLPTSCTLKSFTANGQVLHCITWVDSYQKNIPLIKEVITETNTVIFDATTKKKVLNNVQKSTAITEKHFLDVKQTVSETIDRKRSEGYIFMLLPNGDINLKTKSQNSTLTYNAEKKEYTAAKKK